VKNPTDGAEKSQEKIFKVAVRRAAKYSPLKEMVQSSSYHFGPIDLNNEDRANVGEQGEGQPLQDT
jgi:hypothetical protein